MADWNPQANDIFLQALEIRSAEERVAFVEIHCAGDAGLLAQVESLLKSRDQVGSFLEFPASAIGGTSVQSADRYVGNTIGPYKLLEQIGEGGMGIVYLAEQETPVRRLVALKIVKPGMDTRAVIARFEAERQALALMDHSNIARVLDAGATDSGRPYFVMEVVRGLSITEYCDSNNLTLVARLELFVQICHAVQHAHQKGIIHRDLKPSNVLVALNDGRPVPKVIDFGIAKAIDQQLTDKTLLTNFDQLIGTPLYMSPEQAEKSEQGIDTRSDIYSLGVLLYELLTGTTPFEKDRLRNAAYDEVRRIIREEEPLRPSLRISTLGDTRVIMVANRKVDPQRLSNLVRGDLDWIVMKSLEKDRARRYETAAGFAVDVLRHLNDQPVEACPPSAVYRLRKYWRRNRVALTAGILISLALVLGTVVSIWQAIRAEAARAAEAGQRAIADEQRRAAEKQRVEVEKQREQAEANFQQARQTVDEYFTLVSESKLLDVPGLQHLRKDLLEAALRYYQKVAEDRASDPAVLTDLAAAYMRVSVVFHVVDQNDDAMVAFDKALQIIDRLRQEYPDAHEQHRRLAGYWRGYRPTQVSTEMPRDPEATFRSLQKMARNWEQFIEENPSTVGFRSDLSSLYGTMQELLNGLGRYAEEISNLTNMRALLEKLVVDHPTVPEYHADLARVYEVWASGLTRINRLPEAKALREKSIAMLEQLVVECPDASQYRAELAIGLSLVGRNLMNSDQAEAKKAYRRAIELAQPLVRESPSTTYFAQYLATYISAMEKLGEPIEADDARRHLVELYEKCIADHPENTKYPEILAEVYGELSTAWANRSDDGKSAEEMRRRQVELLEKLAAQFPDKAIYLEKQGKSHSTAGTSYRNTGRHAQAVTSYQKAIEVLDKLIVSFPDLPAPGHRQLFADAYISLGIELLQLKRYEEAEAAMLRALKLFQELAVRVPGETWPPDNIARIRHYLGKLQRRLLRNVEAEQSCRQAIDIWQQLLVAIPSQHVFRGGIIHAYSDLIGLLYDADRKQEADELSFESDALCRELLASSQDSVVLNNAAWNRIVASDPAQRAPELAIELATKAVNVAPLRAPRYSTLGTAFYRAGQWQPAIASLMKSEELVSGKDHGANSFFLAMAHWQLGDKDQARKWYSEAVKWTARNQPDDEVIHRFQDEASRLLESSEAGM